MRSNARVGLAGVGVTFCTLFLAVTVHHDGTANGVGTRDSASVAAPRVRAATPPTGPYVALGDSYTAGPRIPDRTGSPVGCARSDRNYPALVARELNIKAADFRDVSCDGATIGALTAAQDTGDGVNPAQLSALSASTELVTVGIGGNDIGFAPLIKECAKAGILYYATGSGKDTGDDSPCATRHTNDDSDAVRKKIDAAGDRLSAALAEIGRRAPRAQVYVVGYPAILPAEASDCGQDMGLAPGDVGYLHRTEQRLNSMLRQRALAAGAGYVDTFTPSTGHDACSARATRWVEPLIPLSPAAPVHPNERGERGMADAVLATLKGA